MMGKLRSLRRAIERNPEVWLTDYWASENSYWVTRVTRTGSFGYISEYNRQTRKWDKKYIGPNTFCPYTGVFGNGRRYRSFVVHVLTELGYTIRTKRY